MSDLLTGPALLDRARTALAVPLAAGLGIRLVDDSDIGQGAWLEVAGLADNEAGAVHAAALNALTELAGYLAVAPTLQPDQHAVTHSVTTHLAAAARSGEVVMARGRLDGRTGRLAFVDVEARVGARLVGRTTLVKSIVAYRGA